MDSSAVLALITHTKAVVLILIYYTLSIAIPLELLPAIPNDLLLQTEGAQTVCVQPDYVGVYEIWASAFDGAEVIYCNMW